MRGVEVGRDTIMPYPTNYAVDSAAVGPTPPVLGVTITAAAGAAPAAAPSYFGAADAGGYKYYVLPIGSGGVGAPAQVPSAGLAAIAVAAGQVVTINVQDALIQGNGDSQVQYYWLIRSQKDSTTAFDVIHMWPKNTAGTAAGTKIVDSNFFRNQWSAIVGLTNQPSTLHWLQFLDFFQFPLAQVATSIPVLMLNFGGPAVLAPKKHVVLTGCAAS